MKATRRQELRSNELADWVSNIVAYVQARSQTIIVVLVAAVVLLGVAMYWRSSAQSRRVEGWQTLLILLSTSKQQDPAVLDKLEQVPGSYSDPALKAMAYAQVGNRLVDEATLADKPEVAQDYLGRAEAAFQAILAQTPDQRYPAAIARMGLGSLAADRGDFDSAKRYYEMVGNDEQLKGTPFPAEASAALTALEAARKLPPLAATTQPAEAAVASTQPANG